MGHKTRKSLVVLERDWQLRQFLAANLPDDCAWVAFGPGAISSLESQGIPYRTPEEFYDLPDIIPVYDRARTAIEQITEFGDQTLWDLWPEVASKQLRPFKFNTYPFVLGLQTLFRRAFELEKILEAIEPESIHIIRPGPGRPQVLPFSQRELVVSKLILELSDQRFGAVEALEYQPPVIPGAPAS